MGSVKRLKDLFICICDEPLTLNRVKRLSLLTHRDEERKQKAIYSFINYKNLVNASTKNLRKRLITSHTGHVKRIALLHLCSYVWHDTILIIYCVATH
jgi:hypothetical protein